MRDVVVSVVIPTYKRSEMLERAINSALNQTLKEIEIIVVDDNDPNTIYRSKTEKFMERYSNDERVKYLKHEKNKNGAAARNTGIANSKGKYIALLDDDDFYYPAKLEKQAKYLDENPDVGGVYCGRVQKARKIYGILEGDLSREILTQVFTPTTPALMFRKSVLENIGGFDESFRRHQDYELLLKFFKNYKLGVIKEPLVEIGDNSGENELHGEKLEENKKKFLELFKDDIERLDQNLPGFKNKVYISHYKSVFWDHISKKNLKRAVKVYFYGCSFGILKWNFALFSYAFYFIKVKLHTTVKRNH